MSRKIILDQRFRFLKGANLLSTFRLMIEIVSKSLKAHIIPYGAALAGLWHREAPYSLVLGSAEAAAYKSELAYFGAIVGPVANRVACAKISLGGSQWEMERNEGANCLHSGSGGTHDREWQVSKRSAASVTLKLDLQHGTSGLPGNRILTARYHVTDNNTLHLSLKAQSDADTVMNMAHHPYWNLDAQPTVRDHKLSVQAKHYLPVDAQRLPTGQVKPVVGTEYDFLSPRPVPTHIALDNNFCLSDDRRRAPELAAILTGSSGMTLRIETTEPGLQVYNGSGISPCSYPLNDDRTIGPHAGIALEPQGWPDAPHHPHFPQIWLDAGGIYHQETRYRLS